MKNIYFIFVVLLFAHNFVSINSVKVKKDKSKNSLSTKTKVFYYDYAYVHDTKMDCSQFIKFEDIPKLEDKNEIFLNAVYYKDVIYSAMYPDLENISTPEECYIDKCPSVELLNKEYPEWIAIGVCEGANFPSENPPVLLPDRNLDVDDCSE